MKYSVIKHRRKQIYVYFGMAAISEFCDIQEISLNEFLKDGLNDMKLSDSLTLAFVALKHGHRRAEQPFLLSDKDDLADMLDEDMSLLAKIMDIINDSNINKTEEQKKTATAIKKAV